MADVPDGDAQPDDGVQAVHNLLTETESEENKIPCTVQAPVTCTNNNNHKEKEIGLPKHEDDSKIDQYFGGERSVVNLCTVHVEKDTIVKYLKKKVRQHEEVAANVVHEQLVPQEPYQKIKLPRQKRCSKVGNRKEFAHKYRGKKKYVALVDESKSPSEQVKNRVVSLHPDLNKETVSLEKTASSTGYLISAKRDLKFKILDEVLPTSIDAALNNIDSLKERHKNLWRNLPLRDITNLSPPLWNRVILTYPGRKRRNRRSNQRSRENESEPEQCSEDKYPVQESQDERDRASTNVVPSTLASFRTAGTLDYFRDSHNSPMNRCTPTVPFRRPQHPEYRDGTIRRESFANWPKCELQDPDDMASYGFFYTGLFDLVRCFQCGIGLKDWDITETPLYEHIRHSPECPFLPTVLSEDVLNSYKMNLLPRRTEPSRPAAMDSIPSEPEPVITRDEPSTAVRSPQYSTIGSRIDSFQDPWPISHVQTAQQLADAGFYYTGLGDMCRCYACDGGLQHWDPDDNPWVEHTRWFPQCQFVVQTRGQDYVELIQRAVHDAGADLDEEEPEVSQPHDSKDVTEITTHTAAMNISGPSVPPVGGSPISIDREDGMMWTDAARSVLEMGYSSEAIQMAVQTVTAAGNKSYTVDDLLDVLIADDRAGETSSSGSAQASVPDLLSPGATSADYDVTVRRENIRLKTIFKCSECRDRDSNILLMPCTHRQLCEQCAQAITVCPTCGTAIKDKVKTFMS